MQNFGYTAALLFAVHALSNTLDDLVPKHHIMVNPDMIPHR